MEGFAVGSGYVEFFEIGDAELGGVWDFCSRAGGNVPGVYYFTARDVSAGFGARRCGRSYFCLK